MIETNRDQIAQCAAKTPEHAVQRQNGMAKLIMKIRHKLNTQNQNEPISILAVDIKGAFPNSDRHQMKAQINKHLPNFNGIFQFL